VKHYPNYKPVDSYWFSQIPSHWDITKNKFILELDKNVVGERWTDFTLLTMGKSGVSLRDLDGGGKFPESFDTYQEVKPGHLIFCLFDLDETPRTVGLSNLYGMITSAYDVFRCKNDVEPRYINYFYQSIDDVKGLKPYYTGLRKVVRSDTFLGINFFLPPLSEQKQISDYLDRKTQQIDDLIEKTGRKIELLKEQRSSLINQCVTKGLDPNVEMKDSGVEWIGEIPKGWEITRLVSIGDFSKGKNITKDELRETGHPCIVYSQLYTVYERLVTSVISFIDDDKFEETTKVGPGTFLFTSSGETIEEIGKCVLYDGDSEVSVGGDMVIFKIGEKREFDTYFLSYISNSEFFQYQKSANSRGEIVVHVYERQLRDMRFTIPPLSEQKQISDYLDQETSKIDRMVDIETKRIDLLKEYRQSLVSNVVTGKIDVRDEVIQ
jgi:type I restriction enzyme, S subunit